MGAFFRSVGFKIRLALAFTLLGFALVYFAAAAAAVLAVVMVAVGVIVAVGSLFGGRSGA